MKKKMGRWLFVCLVMALTACAFNVISVNRIPAKMDKALSSPKRFVLQEGADIRLDTGYSRKLKPGSAWQYVGALSQGEVYRTRDQVLTVEGSNIYEAYIVVSKNKLIGFYLPVEKSFSPLGKPVTLSLKNQ